MLRVLHEQGFHVDELIECATNGIRFILRERKRETGLVSVVHPWETGADNSPRWDPWCIDRSGSAEWNRQKDRFVVSLNVNSHGAAVSNPLFSAAPASFNALVAFNAREVAEISNDSKLRDEAVELAEALDQTYLTDLATWADTMPDGRVSSSIRTLDALLPALVSPRADRIEKSLRLTIDSLAFGAPYGPSGVDQREPSFDPDAYWRGASWPQLTYLFSVAAARSGFLEIREVLANNAIRAAISSNFAEFLNPITGEGHGAAFQSWACLPVVLLSRIDIASVDRTPRTHG
jgi:glycogen debranching enzyme